MKHVKLKRDKTTFWKFVDIEKLDSLKICPNRLQIGWIIPKEIIRARWYSLRVFMTTFCRFFCLFWVELSLIPPQNPKNAEINMDFFRVPHPNCKPITRFSLLLFSVADSQIRTLAQENIVDINVNEGAAASSDDESEG